MFELENGRAYNVISKYVNLEVTPDMIKICNLAYFEKYVTKFGYSRFNAATVRLDNGSIYIIVSNDFDNLPKEEQNFIILNELVRCYSHRTLENGYACGVCDFSKPVDENLLKANDSLTKLVTKLIYNEVFKKDVKDTNFFNSIKEKYLSKVIGNKLSKEEFLKLYFEKHPKEFEELCKKNFTVSSLRNKLSLIWNM